MSARAAESSELIRRLALVPHPEGGWYREIHRSDGRVDTYRGTRSAITVIYYLLEQNQHSRWHVVESDEVWHFHAGAPLELLAYDPSSRKLTRHMIGLPQEAPEPIAIIPAGVWQAARSTGAYSLVGCTVGPGFEFADFRFVADIADHREHFTGELAALTDLL